MREILFRGKRTDTGEWLEGYFCKRRIEDTCYITQSEGGDCCNEYFVDYEVIPETVGQYTGLTDRNGKKIFEGDIIRYTRTNMFAPSCSFHNQDLVSLHLILWDSSVSAFVQRHYELNGKRILGKGSAVLYDERAKENIVEIIGNIHDNPELLD
jgi:uncharacterized phage protein (TIGR01671 family)